MRISHCFLWLLSILTAAVLPVFGEMSIRAEDNLTIAVVGPMSGKSEANGKSILQGVQAYIESVNGEGGINGKKLVLDIYDDQNNPNKAAEMAQLIHKNNRALAVIGHNYSSCSLRSGEIYRQHSIPAISPTSTDINVTKNNDWFFRTVYNDKLQGRFLANYAVKILKHKNVSIIHEDLTYGFYLAKVFSEAVKELGGQVKFQRTFQVSDPDISKTFTNIVSDLKNIDAKETLFLAMHGAEGVELVHQIKQAGLQFTIITPDSFASQIFSQGFSRYAEEQQNPGIFTQDVLVTTPLIYDTANEDAQNFKEIYKAKFGIDPDWIAAFAYDSAMLIVAAMKQGAISGKPDQLSDDRRKIKDFFAGLTQSFKAIPGVTGYNYFDNNGDAQKGISIGKYSNNSIISAATQLQGIYNIRQVFNLEKKLEKEHVVLIDNMNMYKTNVVYTGIKINKISELDITNLTHNLDFYLWFRYQGDITPENVVFANAAEPIAIGKPIKEMIVNNETYRLYHIKGLFTADFLPGNYGLGQHVLGFSFNHNTYPKSRLIYVSDVLGMGIASDRPMLDRIRENQVLSSTSGWFINRVWFFQDTVLIDSLGTPQDLNTPEGVAYSRFNVGFKIQKDKLTLRGLIPLKAATYLMYASTGLLLLIFFFGRKRPLKNIAKVRWLMTALACMLLLLVCEVVLADIIAQITSMQDQHRLVVTFDMLWWFIPAILLNMAAESFLWIPLEDKTGRVIPKIVRRLLSFSIYTLAFFGIIAFVFDQKLTSLLATSGVIAMIIGLAIQANISNVFSGIALNIERPLRVGDWVKIGNTDEGKVIDMTWRTIKILNRDQCITSIPNSVASDVSVRNFSMPDDNVKTFITIHVDPSHDPSQIEKILIDAVIATPGIVYKPPPIISFKGVEDNVATYIVFFFINNYQKVFTLEKAVLKNVWHHFKHAGISTIKQQNIAFITPPNNAEPLPETLKALSNIKIFDAFSDATKTNLSQHMYAEAYSAGETIVNQDDMSNSMFVIIEGVVGVMVKLHDGHDVEVTRFSVGDFFGESAMISGGPRTASVIALTPSRLFQIKREDILPIINEYPEVQKQFQSILAQRTTKIESGRKTKQALQDEQHEQSDHGFLARVKRLFSVRKQPRLRVLKDIELTVRIQGPDGLAIAAELEDIHSSGLCFRKNLEKPFRRGDRVQIELKTPTHLDETISVLGTISYHSELLSEKNVDKYGVEFQKLSPIRIKQIEQILHELKGSKDFGNN